jgi:hypothetical protein
MLGFLVILSSCSGLKLKVKNGSTETFKKVTINVGKKTYEFENLRSGEVTAPIELEGSYSFFPTEIITEKDTIISNQFCYVGEDYYKSGRLIVSLEIINTEEGKFIAFKYNK